MNLLVRFFRHEAAGGVILMLATLLALICQNSSLSGIYQEILHSEFSVRFRNLEFAEHLVLWINDGLMVIFFFVVGLELKKEVREGELSKPSQIALPAMGALGGIVIPAAIFWLFNHGDDFAIRGWAVPTATDIAFAVGILALLGKRVPSGLKIFLLTLAVVDDLCAILIIALFYTDHLSMVSFLIAGFLLGVMWLLNYARVAKKSVYVFLTFLLWISVLNSGVHATIAGVLAAFCIPMVDRNGNRMLDELYHDLEGVTNFFILPIFAFVNAGVALTGINPNQLLNSVSYGIFFGLFFGKQLGIFIFTFVFIKILRLGSLPSGATWTQLYGVCILGGIGFTMSLFVNGLAYGNSDKFFFADKLSILIASLASGLFGYLFLYFCSKAKEKKLSKN